MKSRQLQKAFDRQAKRTDEELLRDRIEEGRTRPTVAKRLQGYEQSNPRCGNCKDFVDKGVHLTIDSRPKVVQLYCGLGNFSVKAGGCCDLWRGRDGAVLENPSTGEGH